MAGDVVRWNRRWRSGLTAVDVRRAKRREAKVLPVLVLRVVEADSGTARGPGSERAESAASCPRVKCLSYLLPVLEKSDNGWIYAGDSGFQNVAVGSICRHALSLEIPVAAVWTVPSSYMAVGIAGHDTAIGFVSGNTQGGDCSPEPQLDFMAAGSRRCLSYPDSGYGRLIGTPGSGENGGRVTKLGRLIHSKRKAGRCLDVSPEAAEMLDTSALRQTCPCAASDNPVAFLADRVLALREVGGVGVLRCCAGIGWDWARQVLALPPAAVDARKEEEKRSWREEDSQK